MGIFSDRFEYDDFDYGGKDKPHEELERDKIYNQALDDLLIKLNQMQKDSTGRVLIWKVKLELQSLRK